MENTRNCPKCNEEITYTYKKSLIRAVKKNSFCLNCKEHSKKYQWSSEFNCIYCNKEVIFKQSRKIDYVYKCRSCTIKGDRNPFYGKKHTEETKQKLSIAFGGKNNNMYGKPSAIGGGRGWSGWYKGWHFRSFLELSYMINVLEKEGLSWESGEQKKLRISYLNYQGIAQTYCADFLVDNTKLIEIKPKILHTSVIVILKKEAAEKFCEEHGWTYELIEPERLTEEEIITLYDLDKIKLVSRYNEKWKEKYLIKGEE